MCKLLTTELAKLLKKREANPLVWGLCCSTTRVHAWVPLGDGACCCMQSRCTALWGTARAMQRCGRMCCTIPPVLAPHVVQADCIFPPGCLRDVPQAVLAHLLMCRVVDVDLEYASSEERCQCGDM